MLHHGAAIELWELCADRAGRQRLVTQDIKDRTPVRRRQGAKNAVLLFLN
jgi:hypothetical protein